MKSKLRRCVQYVATAGVFALGFTAAAFAADTGTSGARQGMPPGQSNTNAVGTTGTPPGQAQTTPVGVGTTGTPPGQTQTQPQQPPSPAGPPPGVGPGGERVGGGAGEGCPGAIFTTDAGQSQQNANTYAFGAAVYIAGQNFPEAPISVYVDDVNDGSTVVGVQPFGTGAASFLRQLPLPASGAFAAGHEYKAVVVYERSGQPSCQKSDNFFVVGTSGQQTTTGQQTTGAAAGCPPLLTTSRIFERGRTAVGVVVNNVDGSPAVGVNVVVTGPGTSLTGVTNAGGFVQFTLTGSRGARFDVTVPNICTAPATITTTPNPERVAAFTSGGAEAAAAAGAVAGAIRVVPSATNCPGVTVTPRSLQAGRRTSVTVRARLFGRPIVNAFVRLTGVGVSASGATGANGAVTFDVTAREAGVLTATIPNVTTCAKRTGVLGATTGGQLTG